MINTSLVRMSAIMAAVSSVVFVDGANAAEFSPAIRAGITYTDNVFLDSVDEQSEVIYRLEPSFSFLHESKRITATTNYLLQSLWYQDQGGDSIYHQYDASFEFSLIPDALTFEVGGDRSQSVADPRQPIPQSNLPLSTNRVDRDEYYVLPRLQTQIGSSVSLNTLYRHSWVDYDRRTIQGLENQDAIFSIDNYVRGRGLTWALKYDWRRSEYDNGTPWENQRATAELGAWVTEKLRLFASGGRESAWDNPFDSSLEESIWEAGFAYQSADRITAEFAAGERSFGSSWRGSLGYRFRRGSTTLKYTETPNTEGRVRYSGGVPTTAVPITNDLSFPGRNDRFISQRLDWNLTLDFRRTVFSINIYNDERTDRTDVVGVPLSDQSLVGGNVSASYELGARTNLRLSGTRSEREFELDEIRDVERYSVIVDYELGRRTSLTFEYRFTEAQRTDASLPGREYDSNSVSLLFAWEL